VFAQSVTGDEAEPDGGIPARGCGRRVPVGGVVGSNRLDDHGVSGFVINTRDISERKQREEKLSPGSASGRGDLNYANSRGDGLASRRRRGRNRRCGAGRDPPGERGAGVRSRTAALAESVPSFFDEQPSYDRDSPPGLARFPRVETRTAATSRSPSTTCRRTISSRRPPAQASLLHPIGDHGRNV